MFSIIAGILASVLPNLVFAKVFLGRRSTSAQAVVRFFYLGGALKFVSMVCLFCAFLQIPGLHVLGFFSTFLLSELICLFYKFFMLARTTAK